MEQPDYYGILGIERDAVAEEIRSAYRELARRLHPDTSENTHDSELFLQLQEAYEVLSAPEKRAKYDASLPASFFAPAPLTANVLYSRCSLLRMKEAQLVYVMLKLTAKPDTQQNTTPPLNVSLVIDCSTSMQGTLMDTVKASAIEIVRQLQPQDILSIIKFNDFAEVIVPASHHQDHGKIETRIRMLSAGGGTEIYKGLSAGYSEVRRYCSPYYVNHIILITDGVTYGDEPACIRLAETASFQGIGVSGLGIGNKWNDAFLDNLASLSGGSCQFVSKVKDIEQFLKGKFRQLGNSFAEHVVYHLKPTDYADLKYAFRIQPEVSPIPLEPPLTLGSVPRDKDLEVLLEFLVKPIPSLEDQISLAKGRIFFDIPSQSARNISLRAELKVSAGDEQDGISPPQELIQAMSKLTLYRMQERARQDVSEGKIQDATRRLQYLATNLLSQGKPDLAKVVMEEAVYIQENQASSEGGSKHVKYGTRSLLLPPGLLEEKQ